MSLIPNPKDRIAAGYALDLNDSNATLDRVEEALAWINHSPENRHAFERTQRFLDACDRLSEMPDDKPRIVRSSGVLIRSFYYPLLAASIAIFMLTVTVMTISFFYKRQSEEGGVAFHDQYATNVGELRTLVLPDGSSVVLGGSSAISVNYQKNERRIHLMQGEALFAVAKDRARPFSVKSGNGLVTARGTEFQVKRETKNTVVTLVHGFVDVTSKGHAGEGLTHLKPGMQIGLADDGKMGQPKYVDVSRVIDWRNGLLHFEDTPLSLVVADLNRYSKRAIIVENQNIENIRVTGSVKIETIGDWLRGLATAFDIEIDQSNPTVIQLRARNVSRPLA